MNPLQQACALLADTVELPIANGSSDHAMLVGLLARYRAALAHLIGYAAGLLEESR